MKFRFPDNPKQVGPEVLYQLEKEEPGKHIIQPKFDGWRRPLYFENGQWQQFSKHEAHARSAPPLSLMLELSALGFPEGTAFDAEWMGMRAVDHLKGRHYFVLFDLLYFGGQWQGDIPCEQRYGNLKTLFELHKAKTKNASPNIELMPIVEVGWLEFYERTKSMPITEGVVCKARDSRLKGSLSSCQDNGLWRKIKWRA